MKWVFRLINVVSILFFLLPVRFTVSAQINIVPGQTAEVLAQKIAGQGVTITNASLHCPSGANGLFAVTGSNLGLDSGILLTTGRAATSGSNYGINGYSVFLASTDNGAPGDPSLDLLAGQRTVDACSLEFDVIPNGDTIKFNYVFSSEEYINSVCGPYNDAFAFFISGPGIVGYENIALVPGTKIPVTINTINNGIPGVTGNIVNCTKMGPGSPFTSYYVDNVSGTTLTHRGFTKILQAVHSVTPCSIYHLRIVIADAGDPLYDSGVFLEAGSLQTDNFSVKAIPSPPGTSSACVKGCQPGHFKIKRSVVKSIPQTLKLIMSGTAVNGFDYESVANTVIIPANSDEADIIVNGLPTQLLGPKELKLLIVSPYICNGINDILDSASIIIYDSLHVSIQTPDTIVCGYVNTLLKVSGDDILNYSWSPSTGLNNPGIREPIASPSVNTDYTVTVTLPGTSCKAKTAHVRFGIKLTPEITLGSDTTVCFNSTFIIDAATKSDNPFYKYKWDGPNGFSSLVLDPLVSTSGAETAGIYTITVTNDTNNCKATAFMKVSVTTPDTPLITSPGILCLNAPPTAISAKGEHLRWYQLPGPGASDEAPVPLTDQIAIYVYYVSQTVNNCESPKAIVKVEVKKCCDGVINIPTAFTPNGDGRNDKFGPMEDYGYSIKSMYIFNRWGQVVFSGTNGSWDGTFRGMPAEMGDYVYRITFGCILGGTMERQGDVTLIR